jgi:Protein of unknown function (DUF2844)
MFTYPVPMARPSRFAAFLPALAGTLLFIFIFILTAATPSRAALGGDVASVQADQAHMQGTRRTTASASYTLHEIQAGTGTVVREYVSSEGKVFAVAWEGPWPPDLRQILGSYFDQYTQAVKVKSGVRVARRPISIERPGLVFQAIGHSRSFSGRAYIPEQMPSSVTAEAIR